MSSLSDIKRRLTSVKQTRRITGAMKTVSVAKMQKAVELYENSRAYTDIIAHIMFAVSDSVDAESNKYFDRAGNGKKLVIVLSTDRGLCGGFDNEILKLADGMLGGDTVIMPIGKAAEEHFRNNKNVIKDFIGSYVADHAVAERITQKIFDLYDGDVCEVYIAFGEMTSRASYTPTVKKLLPIQKPNDTKISDISVFEPSEKEILKTVLPLYVSATVYGAIVNNIVAEHCARRAAMSAATDSADKLIDVLSLEYNRARQATVTEQIIEIIGSTGALDQQGDGNEKRS